MRERAGRLVAVVIMLAACAGCLESGVVECSDGRICVAGFVCGIDSCVRENFCGGLELGTSCAAPGIAVGGCVDGACLPTICGDARVDGSEECDEADFLNHDGCSSVCTDEAPVWTQLSTTTKPGGRSDGAMVFDARRARIVLFGGAGFGNYYPDTWEWDGEVWRNVTPTAVSSSPSARISSMIAYDAKRDLTVVFGGFSVSVSTLADTWTWNGTAWTLMPTSPAPPGRNSAVMAYDAASERIVLFGGSIGSATVADTWTWDGTSWKNVTPASGSPPARRGSAMAYDPVRERIVLFGGTSSNVPLSDTWEWNGTAWTEIVPATTVPSGRTGHAMIYNATRRRILVHGGDQNSEAWEWDGSDWTLAFVAGTSPQRSEHMFAYDTARAQTIMFGGAGVGLPTDETWTFQYRDDVPAEDCQIGGDADGDGLAGCTDPDCWGYCTPFCPPRASCPAPVAGCGDSQCNPSLDLCSLCPQDCTAMCP